MENKKITNSPSSTNGITAAERLKSSYEHFTAECSKLFPKVDQKLLLDMIHLQILKWTQIKRKRKCINGFKRCLTRLSKGEH